MQRLLRRGRSAHVLNHEATMERLCKPSLREGSLQGQFEDMNAIAFFAELIGYRISPEDRPSPPFLWRGEY